MSMPTISDINPNINISRNDAMNIIIASIAMEELALAHILNAEGEKLQYVLGTLDGKDPGEVSICDVMAVNDSVSKTIKDVIKAEMMLQFKLETALDLNEEENRMTIEGEKIWHDGNNAADTRPAQVRINLLRDGVLYRSTTIDSMGDCQFKFTCLPIWENSEHKYTYTVDEEPVSGYTKSIRGYNITNTVEPGSIDIEGAKVWVDDDDIADARPTEITVRLLQNGVEIRSIQVNSPTAPINTEPFRFDGVPQFDSDGQLYTYTVDEDPVTGYSKSVTGFTITNTII